MKWLCVGYVLFLSSVSLGNAGAVCDNGRFNIHLDLTDENMYVCPGQYWPLPSQVLPSIATRYKPENSSHVCMDTQIHYTAHIPNSGVHRVQWARYGEYIFCPPQRWVHNLEHGGVAFLYHPCVHPQLRDALSQVARRCLHKHIITPHLNLTRERPLALVTWCSTLEMPSVDVKEVRDWLRLNIYSVAKHEIETDGSYQHLLIRPSTVTSDEHNLDVCHKQFFQIKKGRLKRWRRGASLLAPVLTSPITPIHSDTDKTLYNLPNGTGAMTATDHTSVNVSNSQSIVVYPVLVSGITTSSSLEPDFQGIVTLAPPQMSHQEAALGDPGGSRHTGDPSLSEFLVSWNATTLKSISQGSSEMNRIASNAEKSKSTLGVADDGKELHSLSGDKKEPSSVQLNKQSGNTATESAVIEKGQKKVTDHTLRPMSTTAPEGDLKQECICKHKVTQQPSAMAQKASGSGHLKSSDMHISTPRTEEAVWAAASLTFLFVLLTLSVLYTQIYKKFRKSQSLYWASENDSGETETVASVIKRRLIQGHTKRKKWIGRKKTPVVLYESLSESSD
ncbi:tumor protein p53-inducible protein 13 [Rhinophrynus dorsalis]